MKFRKGDKVKFLDDTSDGIITEVIDKKLVKVMIKDGFEIPVLVDEIIFDGSDSENSAEKEIVSSKNIEYTLEIPGDTENEYINISENVANDANCNLYLGFIPQESSNVNVSDIELYIINDGEYSISYLVGFRENIDYNYCKSGILEANTKICIYTFTQTDISKIKSFNVQAIFLSRGKYKPKTPINKYVESDVYSFYKQSIYKENDYFDNHALIVPLNNNLSEDTLLDLNTNDLEEVLKEKQDIQAKVGSPVKVNKEVEEVDLHIHNLVENESGLSNGEIVNIQLDAFRKAMNSAILNKTKKIVFIHGVGNGKLKYELRKELEEKYPDCIYQDASFKQYGFGATMVHIK